MTPKIWSASGFAMNSKIQELLIEAQLWSQNVTLEFAVFRNDPLIHRAHWLRRDHQSCNLNKFEMQNFKLGNCPLIPDPAIPI
jgi:hypothetical protein